MVGGKLSAFADDAGHARANIKAIASAASVQHFRFPIMLLPTDTLSGTLTRLAIRAPAAGKGIR